MSLAGSFGGVILMVISLSVMVILMVVILMVVILMVIVVSCWLGFLVWKTVGIMSTVMLLGQIEGGRLRVIRCSVGCRTILVAWVRWVVCIL